MSWREEILTADEMRAAEAAYPGPSLDLMERAGRACAEAGVVAHGAGQCTAAAGPTAATASWQRGTFCAREDA